MRGKMDKRKILKIFIIIIAMLFFIIGCFSIYKFIIIRKIFNKMEEYVALENFYMEITSANNDSITQKVYYKDGIGKLINYDGTYTWTDGKEAYLVDDENKKIQTVNWETPTLISNEYVGSMIPGYSKSFIETFILAGDLNTSVKIKDYEKIKYYVITTEEKGITKTIWFLYDTLIPSQITVKIADIAETYYYDITFENVEEKSIQKPNVNEYTLEKE